MKCDVFISYSRNDKKRAESLCKALTTAGVDYWIDRKIRGSENFLTEVVHYIDSCKVVLFIASANSAKSEWTPKELLRALNLKKTILPYCIGDYDNSDLDFIFTNIQWVESEEEVIAALEKLGLCRKTLSQIATAPRPVSTKITKIYKVGDYYNDGAREGVVFEVSADGRHGKIVSMKQSAEGLQWATAEKRFVLFKSESCRLIGADSQTDGVVNAVKVWKRSEWQNRYPAFAWCADLGDGWYLPSIDELKIFTLNDAVHDAVNRTLFAKGGTKLYNRGKSVWYWSSTENEHKRQSGELSAWFVNMDSGFAYYGSKCGSYSVRAVAIF